MPIAGGTALSLISATFAFADDTAAIRGTPEQVIIQAGQPDDYKVDVPSLSKLPEPLVDTPQSVNVLSEQALKDQGVTNLNDALRTVPGVTLGAGEFSWQGNNPTIRGFVARNDMFLDGLRDFGSYYRDPYNLNSIEVLEGPSSGTVRARLDGRRDQSGHRFRSRTALLPAVVGGTDLTRREPSTGISSPGVGPCCRVPAERDAARPGCCRA